jgi:hypothetical protein
MENVVAKGNGLSRRGRGWTGNASLRKAASPGGDDYRVDLTQEEHVFRRIIWLSVSGLAAGAEEKEGSQKREQTKGRQGLMKTSSFLLKIRSTRIWSRVDKKRTRTRTRFPTSIAGAEAGKLPEGRRENTQSTTRRNRLRKIAPAKMARNGVKQIPKRSWGRMQRIASQT